MAHDVVTIYSDALFDLYNRLDTPTRKGFQNGWPYCQTDSLIRIFQEAAKPHITAAAQPRAPAPVPPSFPRPQSLPIWLQNIWPVMIGAFLVVICVVALAWKSRKPPPPDAGTQRPETSFSTMWQEAAQQLVQSHLILNSNQAVLSASQAQLGLGLAKLTDADAQLAASVATQSTAIRELSAAHSALARETTNQLASLRETFRQGLADVATQCRADTAKLQTEIAAVAARPPAVTPVVPDKRPRPNSVQRLSFELPGVTTRPLGKSVLLVFDEGLFLHGTYFKPGAKIRLLAVAKALAEVPAPLRIEVIGCADDDRAFKKWTAQFEESLALDRATAVVNYFIELGLFSPKQLAALSSRCTNRPFSSDTSQNRLKNRTVMLKLSAEEKPKQWQERPAP
jgi:flagellar motor protein MotB